MINISVLFDPRYVFLIYAPILFALNKRVGHRMIIALTCCEWANQVLKWLLAGERPYWYVHERANELLNLTSRESYNFVEQQTDYLQLKQFPVTCELGAGSPSGHAMVTATVWYVLIDAYLKGELSLFNKNGAQGAKAEQDRQASGSTLQAALTRASWAAYFVMIALVSLSRVYLACHFPHQCLCGALLGCVLAKLIVDKLPMERLQAWHFVLCTLIMFATALGTYGVLKARGFDPLWSVNKAMRWCQKPEFIHLDTTPFYSMMRYLGFCLGTGLAYDPAKLLVGKRQQPEAEQMSLSRILLLLVRRTLVVCLSIGFGQLLLSIPLSRSNMNLFYAISFLIYATFAYAFASLIPEFVKSVLPKSVNFKVSSLAVQANGTELNGASGRRKISMKKLL